MPTPHKHASCIIAWANGAAIQSRTDFTKDWADIDHPLWILSVEYRIKPRKVTYWFAIFCLGNGKIQTSTPQPTRHDAEVILEQNLHWDKTKTSFGIRSFEIEENF